MTDRTVSSVPPREPLSPAARIGDLAARRTAAQALVTAAQNAVARAAGALAALASDEPQAADRAQLYRMRAKVGFATTELAGVGRVPGLPVVAEKTEGGGLEE